MHSVAQLPPVPCCLSCCYSSSFTIPTLGECANTGPDASIKHINGGGERRTSVVTADTPGDSQVHWIGWAKLEREDGHGSMDVFFPDFSFFGGGLWGHLFSAFLFGLFS